MSNDDRIIFPDEVESMKAAATAGTGAGKTTADFDYDHVVFPDEVEEMKANAAAAAAGDNSVQAPEIDPREKLQSAGECKCVGHIQCLQFDIRFQNDHNGSKVQVTGRCSSEDAPELDLRFHYHHSGSKEKGTRDCCSVEAS